MVFQTEETITIFQELLVGLLAAIDISWLILCLAGQDKQRTSCEGGFEGWLNIYNLANGNSEITGWIIRSVQTLHAL